MGDHAQAVYVIGNFTRCNHHHHTCYRAANRFPHQAILFNWFNIASQSWGLFVFSLSLTSLPTKSRALSRGAEITLYETRRGLSPYRLKQSISSASSVQVG